MSHEVDYVRAALLQGLPQVLHYCSGLSRGLSFSSHALSFRLYEMKILSRIRAADVILTPSKTEIECRHRSYPLGEGVQSAVEPTVSRAETRFGQNPDAPASRGLPSCNFRISACRKLES
jgi:hypothetical protein